MTKAFFILGVLLVTIGAALWFRQNTPSSVTFNSPAIPKPTPLAIYSFPALSDRSYTGSTITLEKEIAQEETYTSYIFSFTTDGKKVTGQANLPRPGGVSPGKGPFPVVIMLRGYADDDIYFTGLGTRKAAGVFAENGFLTLAPDFLGFGGSDSASSDILESRFEKPITVLNLIESISSLPYANTQNIFIWAHSNGGQIALSVLEISKKSIPTTLWAPVTRGFPESVTDYVGELDDQGKMVLATISAFLEIYNPQEFSVSNYFQDISAPLQVHQGTWDSLVKVEWTNEFVETIKRLDKEVRYYTYPRNDHNFSRDWDTVVARDLDFFRKHIK